MEDRLITIDPPKDDELVTKIDALIEQVAALTAAVNSGKNVGRHHKAPAPDPVPVAPPPAPVVVGEDIINEGSA